ncbi:MAG: DUF456 domain-containing protein [Tannerella sp.]|jgi:uncharacterized protein YqgC (DUF456 family)|nr:DUF456 domain-containing protein [Tannerella sp.]
MAFDIILIVLASVLLLLGLVGSIVPGLAGPPLSYAGLLLIHFTSRAQFTVSQLVWWLALTLLTIIFDYLMPALGVRKWNGSRWGNWGCIIGTVAGCFIFPPWGVIVGPFAGAVLGEMLIARRDVHTAIRAGFGAFVGFLFGTVFKLTVCGWFIWCAVKALIY